MAVKYTIRDGELVSVQWATALDAAEKRSGHNNVNEGKRNLARQTYFWNCGPSGCCCCNNCNLAAFPSPTAPHIRVGRIDHAIDAEDGARLERDLEALGINAWRTVPGEDWHVEADAGDLQRFHEKNSGDKWDVLPRHCERAVRTLFMRRNTARDLNLSIVELRSKSKERQAQKLERKLDRVISGRTRSRKKVERLLERADKESTKRLLRQALKVG